MIRKTISMPDEMGEWISQHIAGSFNNESEYFRSLVRRDQEERDEIFQLKKLLEESRASGTSDKNVLDVMRDVEERMKSDGKL